jgi:hypothetical protein
MENGYVESSCTWHFIFWSQLSTAIQKHSQLHIARTRRIDNDAMQLLARKYFTPCRRASKRSSNLNPDGLRCKFILTCRPVHVPTSTGVFRLNATICAQCLSVLHLFPAERCGVDSCSPHRQGPIGPQSLLVDLLCNKWSVLLCDLFVEKCVDS